MWLGIFQKKKKTGGFSWFIYLYIFLKFDRFFHTNPEFRIIHRFGGSIINLVRLG